MQKTAWKSDCLKANKGNAFQTLKGAKTKTTWMTVI